MKTIKIFAYALMATSAVTLTSCGDDDSSGTTLPPIGGYNSSDEIAAGDLVAYWPLNGDGAESKSGVGPLATGGSVNASWVQGAKGQAVSLNNGYLKYPVIPAINSMTGSFTVSLWAKVANNGTHATSFFAMTRPEDWNGPINVLAETGKGNRAITADTLQVKGAFGITKPDDSFFGGDAVNAEQLSEEDIANGGQVKINKTANQWMHVVYVYDGTTAINKLYVNGQKISNPQWEERNKVGGVNVGVPFHLPATSYPLIGSFSTVVNGAPQGWQGSMKGEVDEIRLYKKVLLQADITALYDLEKAGR